VPAAPRRVHHHGAPYHLHERPSNAPAFDGRRRNSQHEPASTAEHRQRRLWRQIRNLANSGRLALSPTAGVHDIVRFFRRNPQALALLVICLVLGIGAFVAVLIGLASSGSQTGPGYPNGSVFLFHGLLG
jgi:hypothetical protein